MIEWPSTLPYPLEQGYNFKPGTPFYKTQFQFGNRYRKRYCPTDILDLQFIFSIDEMETFREFFYTTLHNGTKEFIANWEVNGDQGTKRFHFTEAYKATKSKRYYRVSASFEVKEYVVAFKRSCEK